MNMNRMYVVREDAVLMNGMTSSKTGRKRLGKSMGWGYDLEFQIEIQCKTTNG